MIRRLLVANRAEIASRVFRTCRALGIETVAVHSDADAGLPYVAEADVAVRLPGTAPADTYLRADLVIEAAKRVGADAVHPGYGFLSENADFARAVSAVGLTWVGPHPDAIERMGSKVLAKQIVADAGVPVLDSIDPEHATEADLPLLVKASAGGGGRGMRVVRSLGALAGEVEQARAEAESAFGDGTVFVERYVERGRHVEVQVLGTPDGIIVLGERDCSLQRRHQKVVEESPAPNLPAGTRQRLHDAGLAAAAAIDYLGAGTVEFLYDEERDELAFLEMNTRLQVEHPVTELVWGVDLVELQIAVAEDRLVSRDVAPSGHAIEVRLYAEDPDRDYQPQSGRLLTFDIPTPPGVRVDAGFAAGSEVTTHYDAMLAKVVAHAPSREQAARKLVGVLERARIHGVRTNREQLTAVLRDPDFLEGRVHTGFLAHVHREFREYDERADVLAAGFALAEHDRLRRTVQHGIPAGWRNVVSQPQRTRFLTDDGDEVVAEWWGDSTGYRVDGYRVVSASPTRVVLEVDGMARHTDVRIDDVDPHRPREVHVDGPGTHVRFREVPRFTDPEAAARAGSLLAAMPGTVVRVDVAAGDAVEAGAPVLVLEAMKMQHAVTAPTAGTVTSVEVDTGAQVAAGDVLAVIDPPFVEPVETQGDA